MSEELDIVVGADGVRRMRVVMELSYDELHALEFALTAERNHLREELKRNMFPSTRRATTALWHGIVSMQSKIPKWRRLLNPSSKFRQVIVYEREKKARKEMCL